MLSNVPVDEVFMHYFQNLSSPFGGFCH